MIVHLARGDARLVERGSGQLYVDLGEVVSLGHAEGKALEVVAVDTDFDGRRVVTADLLSTARGLVLVARFGDIEAMLPFDQLVEAGAPAPAGAWSFQRIVP